jgi:hypothetical protein
MELKALVEVRRALSKRKKAVHSSGWKVPPPGRFNLPKIPSGKPTAMTTFADVDTPILEIFLRQLPLTFAFDIVRARFSERRYRMPSLEAVRIYLAVRIRLQALQEAPSESNPIQQPQRKSFQKALEYFKAFGSVLGIVVLERIHTSFWLTPDDETKLNLFVRSLVTNLGDHVAGDEKLVQYSGKYAWVRMKKVL